MDEKNLTPDELIALGNKRIIEIVGARLGVVNWQNWIFANGWRFVGGKNQSFYANDSWNGSQSATWRDDDEIFMVELRRAMFEPETLVK